MQARFVSGNYNTIPYTPSGAVSAGDVVVEGDLVLIAHNDIAAGVQGAMACGGGVYEVTKTSGTTPALGDEAYWDDSNNQIEDTTTSNTIFGYFAALGVSGETTVRVLHQPH